MMKKRILFILIAFLSLQVFSQGKGSYTILVKNNTSEFLYAGLRIDDRTFGWFPLRIGEEKTISINSRSRTIYYCAFSYKFPKEKTWFGEYGGWYVKEPTEIYKMRREFLTNEYVDGFVLEFTNENMDKSKEVEYVLNLDMLKPLVKIKAKGLKYQNFRNLHSTLLEIKVRSKNEDGTLNNLYLKFKKEPGIMAIQYTVRTENGGYKIYIIIDEDVDGYPDVVHVKEGPSYENTKKTEEWILEYDYENKLESMEKTYLWQ